MRRLCGWHFSVLGVATLPDYELGVDDRGYATVRPFAGKEVLGVLYEVDQYCLDILDDFEGYPEVFLRPIVEILDANGQKLQSWVYLEPKEKFGSGFMRPDYIKRAIIGAEENHLPEEWINFLSGFQPRNF